MRIGLFSDTWLPNINGVVFSLLNQIRILEKEGHEIFLFVPKTHDQKMEKVPENITIFEFPGIEFPSYPGYKMSIPINIRKIAKTQKFDLLHSHSPFLLGWYCMMIRRIQKIPMASTYHTHLAEYAGHLAKGIAEESVKKVLEIPIWSFTKNQYNKYDVIFTPSRQMKAELEHHGLNHVHELPNPITDLFMEKQIDLDEKIQKFKERFHIPIKARVLLYVGRISFEKRIEILLEAYKELEKKYDDIYLVVVGDGPQIGMYKKKAKNLNLKRYIFTGYIHHSQLPVVYGMATAFISPSDTETQGLTFIEAMSQGAPVIAVKARGVIDYIKHNENGYFANKLDPKEFELLIENVLKSPKDLERVRQNAIKTAEGYNYESFKNNLFNGYDQAFEKWRERGKK